MKSIIESARNRLVASSAAAERKASALDTSQVGGENLHGWPWWLKDGSGEFEGWLMYLPVFFLWKYFVESSKE